MQLEMGKIPISRTVASRDKEKHPWIWKLAEEKGIRSVLSSLSGSACWPLYCWP
jgi:hypothetical protein